MEEIIWRRKISLFWRINRAEKEKEEIFGGGTYSLVEEKKRRRKRRGIFGEQKSLSGLGKKITVKVKTSERWVPNGSDKSHQVGLPEVGLPDINLKNIGTII